MNKPKILHIKPDKGGLADYGHIIDKLYELEGFPTQNLDVPSMMTAKNILASLKGLDYDLLHWEIGVGQANLFWASFWLLITSNKKQIATIHDPGIVVKATIARLEYNANTPRPIRLIIRVVRKIANLTINKALIVLWSKSKRIIKIYLRPDLGTRAHSFYLPQPTYHATQNLKASLPFSASKIKIAFAGYWGREKGLETLLEAREIIGESPRLQMILAGGAVSNEDPFVRHIKRKAQQIDDETEITGLIEDEKLDEFLISLNAMILPYWRELPSGTSAMALRAAELGLPIIASDTPALRGQLGDSATYTEPKNARQLADAIKNFLNNPAPAFAVAEKLQRQIFEHHGWEPVGRELADIINRVMG